MFKRLAFFLCALAVGAVLSSCGGGDLGAGIGEFTTVKAKAVSATDRLESDVLTANTCSTSGSAGGTFSTDNVDVTVTSTALFTNALDLNVSQITIQYIPVNAATTPPLPDYFIPTSRTIGPNSSQVFSIPVMPDSYKLNLVDRTTQNLNLCSTDIFEYYVRVVFQISEPGGNGTTRDVTTTLRVAVADRAS